MSDSSLLAAAAEVVAQAQQFTAPIYGLVCDGPAPVPGPLVYPVSGDYSDAVKKGSDELQATKVLVGKIGTLASPGSNVSWSKYSSTLLKSQPEGSTTPGQVRCRFKCSQSVAAASSAGRASLKNKKSSLAHSATCLAEFNVALKNENSRQEYCSSCGSTIAYVDVDFLDPEPNQWPPRRDSGDRINPLECPFYTGEGSHRIRAGVRVSGFLPPKVMANKSATQRLEWIAQRKGVLTHKQKTLLAAVVKSSTSGFDALNQIGGHARRIGSITKLKKLIKQLAASAGGEFANLSLKIDSDPATQPWVLETSGTCPPHVDDIDLRTFSLLVCHTSTEPYMMLLQQGTRSLDIEINSSEYLFFPSGVTHQCLAETGNRRVILNAICKQ